MEGFIRLIRIDSAKCSKKKIRLNFKYPLNINNLNHSQKGSGKVGMGGENFEKESQNIIFPCQLDLV
ncbi:MAG: hypothetical protein H5T85_07880 [Actinobacteria bacterium]|nr:hypothetical protein [Actinomycetota bacterium]